MLGRVERFGGRLQVQVRTVEAAEDADPSALTPSLRGMRTSSTDSSSSSPPRSRTRASPQSSTRSFATRTSESAPVAACRLRRRSPRLRGRPPRAHRRRRNALRETAQLHPRIRHDIVLAAALLHDLGRIRELGPARLSGRRTRAPARTRPPRPADDRGARTGPRPGRARRAAARGCVSPRPPCRGTAEAAVLYHANQLDAQAATRPVGD